ncbi:AAA family ATPase, partial [Microvirga sp. BT689]|uniref:AAA family ATPase n=1 Tax=Microvirga arvi TaxID=2778731 RepID=UPI0019523BE3
MTTPSRLTSDDLKELGVTAVGRRRKLLDAIAHLNDASGLAAKDRLGRTERSVERSASRPAPVHSGAERRHLTVMFCDLVGSTALASALDPEEYRAILYAYHSACTATIARFDGFVAKYMGDGVLAYFGYPQAHEDDGVRAVRAGLALVEEVNHLAVPAGVEFLRARVGIATGLVVVGDLIGMGAAQEESVVGETPNLAARLQTLAPPGGVVIAPAPWRLLGSEFKLTDLGLQDLKGFAAPIAAWQVLGPSVVESRFDAHSTGATPLIGRAEELGRLVRRWEQARAGDGQVVLLSGEAGIGKSRLAREFRGRVQTDPHTAQQYQCSPFFSNSPLYPFIEQIEREAAFREEDTPQERLVKLETLLAQATDDVPALVPFLATMLSIPAGERYALSLRDPQQQRELTIKALISSILGLARRTPLFLLFEDVHWADPTTREVLDKLIDRIVGERVLLLVIVRPEVALAWQGRPHVSEIVLSRLTPRESTELAEEVAG